MSIILGKKNEYGWGHVRNICTWAQGAAYDYGNTSSSDEENEEL
ncbi:hypothetical protein [Domibacillus robiginosus]|nr:hypothetical protein [Domibacillus robiginosus]